ncbi:aminotransferase V [Weizmannia acidilactici]|uniref:Aminotransferase V n=1 Tax=Weizmannia acidilactici TaxID=2607726 RepID=A0A5J4JDQ6_9BACI|nr:cysteine desulfurase family protein [Weizmannia acidilactici]GER66405.1 aminotransferase V [Weizmannia acidilactici]GER69449.1 aminotransferase V [Weizmannia acidilactici]GER72222.1 aminotransferase V [Weizmannia acidilactici]
MIYFDNSATTKPYPEVLDTFVKTSVNYYANPSSLHSLGAQAEKLVTQARQQIANILGVNQNEIVFTSGGTEGNNLAIKGTALEYRARGRHIITTAVEHASVFETCRQLEKLGFRITYLPVDSRGRIRIDDLKAAITDETILVSVMHVNNEVGAVQPVEEIGRLLKNYPKILFHVDHVQGCGKVPLSLHEAGIDLCTISAHKFHGLKGTGVLYKRANIRISPLLTGGHQESQLRSGTENTGGIVAAAKALRLIHEKFENGAAEKTSQIRDYLIEKLAAIPGVTVHTDPEVSAPHIINFSAGGIRGEVLVHALEQQGIFISTTSACSSKTRELSRTLLAMGVSKAEAEGAARISLSYENTMEEAENFIRILQQTIQNLQQVLGRNQ